MKKKKGRWSRFSVLASDLQKRLAVPESRGDIAGAVLEGARGSPIKDYMKGDGVRASNSLVKLVVFSW